MPYRVTVRINDLPDLDWQSARSGMRRDREAPFQIALRPTNSSCRAARTRRRPRWSCPSASPCALERFHLTAWVLSTAVTIERSAPTPGPDGTTVAGEIRSRGQAYITQAAGAFEKFPYPLHDLQAYLEFENDRVNVHYVTGSGTPGSARWCMTGTIAPLGKRAAVDLHLNAHNAPLSS